MTKHVHAEMIKAKADNMELVVFVKCGEADKWRETETPIQFPLSEFDDVKYFACLPQHNENGQCLHWLNGGDVLAVRFDNQIPDSGVMIDSELTDLDDDVNSYPWKLRHIFMDEAQTIVIKPRKEKRWIAVKGRTVSSLYDTKRELELMYATTPDVQFIEIEVEI